MNLQISTCPICQSDAPLLDVVDFHQACEEQRGKFQPLSGLPIYYQLCDYCLFYWSPTMYEWPFNRFAESVCATWIMAEVTVLSDILQKAGWRSQSCYHFVLG